MGFFDFLKSKPPSQVQELYAALVAQARQPAFYVDLAVPDTVDGRFDVLIAHITIMMRRLRQIEGDASETLGQALLETMFTDMDVNLREMGIGDMSVGKHVKKMAKAFYGRAELFETGLDAGGKGALESAMKETLFRNVAPSPAQLERAEAYFVALDHALSGATDGDAVAFRLDAPTV